MRQHIAIFVVAFSLVCSSAVLAGDAKSIEVKKTGAIDCAKTPNVRITHGKLKLTFTGHCASIQVIGGNNEIVADTVDHFDVTGADNRIYAAKAQSFSLIGASNHITWSATIDKTKTDVAVTYVGTDNVVVKGDKAAFEAAKKNPQAATGTKVIIDGKKVNEDAKHAEEDAQKAIQDATKSLGIKIN